MAAATVIRDDAGHALAIVSSEDGMLIPFGRELAEFLAFKTIVDHANNDKLQFEGMGCLAASLIAHLKKNPGEHVLVHDVGGWDEHEYTYEVKPATGQRPHGTTLTMKHLGTIVFQGTPEEFVERERPTIGL